MEKSKDVMKGEKLIENLYRACKKYIVQNYAYYKKTKFITEMRADIQLEIQELMSKGQPAKQKTNPSPYQGNSSTKKLPGLSAEDQCRVDSQIFEIQSTTSQLFKNLMIQLWNDRNVSADFVLQGEIN